MTLTSASESYVTLKRSMGAVFTAQAAILRAFARLRGDLPRPRAALLPAGVDDEMTDRGLARALGFATAAAMAVTQAPVGFVRDEGYYFTAAQRYEEWLQVLVRAPLQAAAATERYWSYNFEHPGLTKLLFALSHLLFTPWLPDTLAWRLPAFVFAGLLSYWLCILGSSRSRAAEFSAGPAAVRRA